MPHQKILLIASLGPSLVNFRGDFIKDLIKHGYEVYCASPEMDDDTAQSLKSFGAHPLSVLMARTGINPFQDLKTIEDLKRIIRENQIDLVFPYTIKPVIYGSIAATQLNVPVISLITGLGMTFSGVNLKFLILQRVAEFLYRRALRKNKAVIFQNIDDLNLFKKKKIIKNGQSTHVVNGSGVNLSRFEYRSNSKRNGATVKFVMVGRMLKSKGTLYYLEAAKQLGKSWENAEFHLIGSSMDDHSGVSKEELQTPHDKGDIIYHGHQTNIPSILEKMDVFVLPSYLREGVPRSILEALSIGMPVVTTNMPGCRETVIPYENGILISPQSQEDLNNGLIYFLKHPEQIEPMGKSSRELAEQKFDVNIINSDLISIIEQFST